jgi:hypothetical protein
MGGALSKIDFGTGTGEAKDTEDHEKKVILKVLLLLDSYSVEEVG